MKSVMAHLMLVASGLVMGFFVLECVLRVAGPIPERHNPLSSFHQSDPRLGWIGKPNIRMRFHRAEFDVLIEHSAEGFRLPDPKPPARAEKSVLFLGDSHTWGWGVGQGQVFTDWLQRKVSPGMAVYNRGVNAFGTAQEYLLLQQEFEKRDYDKVAIMFYFNDVGDNRSGKNGRRPYFELIDNHLVPRNLPAAALGDPIGNFLKKHSRTFSFINYRVNVLKAVWKRRRRKKKGDAAGDASQADIDWHSEDGYPVTARLLTEIGKLSRKHGAQFYIVYIAHKSEYLHQPSRDPYIRATRSMIAEVSLREAIPVIDLAPQFYEKSRQGIRIRFPQDLHWTPTGHQLAAEVLLESEMFRAWRVSSP